MNYSLEPYYTVRNCRKFTYFKNYLKSLCRNKAVPRDISMCNNSQGKNNKMLNIIIYIPKLRSKISSSRERDHASR